MLNHFLPDIYLHELSQITPELLLSLGVRGLCMDIDNTIVTYDDPEPTESARAWFDAIAAAGIKVSFISNNDHARVELFNRTLGYPAYAKAGKPFVKYIKKAVADMGLTPGECAFIGDQIFTDVWAGRRAGLSKCLLVDPIKDKTTLFFKSKRLLEIPLKKIYYKRKNKR